MCPYSCVPVLGHIDFSATGFGDKCKSFFKLGMSAKGIDGSKTWAQDAQCHAYKDRLVQRSSRMCAACERLLTNPKYLGVTSDPF